MRLRLADATALALVAALGLGGCAPTSPHLSVTTTPTPAASASAPETGSTAEPATCDTLLDQVSIDAFAAEQYEPSDDFAQRAVEQGWPEAAFVTNGGLLCQWGYPQSDASEYFGLSPLPAQNAATIAARLVAEGFALHPHADGDLYAGPVSDGRPQLFYFFAADHWFVGFSVARIDEIRRNAGLG